VLDRIGAPLEHLLRNAVAHGLEGSDQRRRLDKPETGEIAVALRQEGDQIVIEVSDDGAGLDVDKLRRKGLEKGLLQPDDAMDPAKLTQLIFTPGFSTADQVTELSGRGIGLDVVGSEVASIGGRIDTSSTPGKGMRFTIVLPLTLAIMDAVLVRGAQHTFAVPSAMIEQVLRVKAHELAQIEAIGAAEFRGHRYPLRRLPHLLGAAPHTQESQVYQSILLLRNGSHRIALHVDELMRNQEIVIKNIGPQFSRVPWISGATVLADGSIVLIINPVQLAQVARPATAPGQPAEPAATEPRPLVVMVVDDSLTVRKVMGRLLEREGYRVLTAKDGVDALEKLGTTVPDVMLLDIEMPRMDGFELARNVRGNPATAGVPMIMISSRGAAKHRNRALEVGIHAFIGKPYEDSELLARIVEVAGSRGQQVVHH
jgi:chemosensory pili system protein ChpA (sensor histidine kinase/response regulator)